MSWPPRSARNAGTPNPGKLPWPGDLIHIKPSRISLSVGRERQLEAKSTAMVSPTWPWCGPRLGALPSISGQLLAFNWWAREGSNLQPDGYEPSGRNGPVVTQIDTQALPRGEAKLPNLLIGLVAEEGLEPPTRGL